MNQGPIIAASGFTAFAVLSLVYLYVTKRPLFAGNLKNFFRAGTGVYLSGTLLLLFFAFALKEVPLVFILISEITIMTVFVVTFIIIIRLSRTLAKMQAKSAAEVQKEEETDE
ncbi:MAG: hypothetical protein J6W36_04375 [Clostridiales bacterium]|nr:hypothetical protein [Clostridiales bacterium]